MAKQKTEGGERPVDLFGLAEVQKGQFAVVRVTVEGSSVTDKEVLFDPEERKYALNNLKAAQARHYYGVMEPG